MHLVDTTRQGALDLVERMTLHVPADEPAGEPRVFYGGTVIITEDDERYALEVDAETGSDFVTRVRKVGPNLAELTVWQAGQELARRVERWGDQPPAGG